MAQTPKQRRNPFRGFLDVMSEMNRAQEQWMLSGNAPTSGEAGRSEATAYVPPADIFALGDDVIVRCEVAGARSEDIQLTVSGGVLTIVGHRDSELDESKVSYYTRERMYGAFRRTMFLPEGIGEENISASVRNGLLEIRVKDAAQAKLHQIRVQDENGD